MQRTIFVAFVLLLFEVFSPAFADELCEVQSPDGTISYVSCCRLGGQGELSDECKTLEAALDTEDVSALERAVTRNHLNTAAAFLRKNPDAVSIGAFSVDPPMQEFVQLCCSCVPGKSCSADVLGVCSATTDGQCAPGDLRVICTSGSSSQECTAID